MKLYRLAVGLLLASSVFAQTANVIELDPADTARAQKAWDALQKAKSEWQSVQDTISNKYLTDPQTVSCQGITCGGRAYSAFDHGYEFSTNFKEIVPKYSGTITGGSGTILNCPTWTTPGYPNGVFQYQCGTAICAY